MMKRYQQGNGILHEIMSPTELMQLAIEKARAGIVAGQSPFGCAIAKDDQVVAVAHNTVMATIDPTAHAEVNAIRLASQELNQVFLENCVVATTCEPCPMCMAALHWARVSTVYFGATIADADEAGFNELTLPATELLRIGGSSVKLIDGTLSDDCESLFQEWLASPHRQAY